MEQGSSSPPAPASLETELLEMRPWYLNFFYNLIFTTDLGVEYILLESTSFMDFGNPTMARKGNGRVLKRQNYVDTSDERRSQLKSPQYLPREQCEQKKKK